MNIGFVSKACNDRKLDVKFTNEFEEDKDKIKLMNSQLEDFLTKMPVRNEQDNYVTGFVVKIINKNKTKDDDEEIEENGDTQIILDIGGKVEGILFASDLKQRLSLLDDENEDKKLQYKVGDSIRVYVEDANPVNGGYAILNREKVVREEMWDKLKESFEKSEIVEGFIFNKVKCGFMVDVQGTVAFLPGSQVDTKIIKDITPLMGKKQPFMILKMDSEQGNIVVSRRAVLESSMSQQRNEILLNISEGDILDGVVKNITKYGAFIDLGGIDGLVHVTDISWKRCNHPFEVLSLGQKIKTKVIKFDKETKRISLGIKQLEESPWLQLAEKFPVGSEVDVTITSIADYGIFAELSALKGVEGLIYQTEVSWSRVINNNPGNYFQKGQELKVKVLDIDTENLRLNLSLKKCSENPWENFSKKYESGQVVEVQVRHIVDFGVFVSLPKVNENDDIEGLIYYSDFSWTENEADFAKKVKKGDVLQAKILVINPEKEKVNLGIKQIEKDPMGDMINTLKVDQMIEGTVRNIFHNEIFVELCDGFEIPLDRSAYPIDSEQGMILNSLNLYSKVQLKILEIVPKYRIIKVDFIKKL